MALPYTFANLTAGNNPASYLDANFAALGAITPIPCSAAGTNSITLTAAANTPTISAYNQLQAYRFVAANTTSAAATIQLGALAPLNTYKPSASGPTATASGDIVSGECYDAVYDSALNSGAGGFHVYAISSNLSLGGNTTFYVRTDGSDTNNGLANTAGGAWLTLQHAWNVISVLDLAGFIATVQIGDGTYAGPLVAWGKVTGQKSAASIVFQGNSGTPTNVVINATSPSSGGTIDVEYGAMVTLKNFRIGATTSGNAIQANFGGRIEFSGLDFSASPGDQINIAQQSSTSATGNYTISGGAARHWNATFPGALIFTAGRTVTISGTPAYSSAFAVASQLADIACSSMTFSGTGATGTRYSASLNGIINTNGGGATYLPGNGAGSTATGGQYV